MPNSSHESHSSDHSGSSSCHTLLHNYYTNDIQFDLDLFTMSGGHILCPPTTKTRSVLVRCFFSLVLVATPMTMPHFITQTKIKRYHHRWERTHGNPCQNLCCSLYLTQLGNRSITPAAPETHLHVAYNVYHDLHVCERSDIAASIFEHFMFRVSSTVTFSSSMMAGAATPPLISGCK